MSMSWPAREKLARIKVEGTPGVVSVSGHPRRLTITCSDPFCHGKQYWTGPDGRVGPVLDSWAQHVVKNHVTGWGPKIMSHPIHY